MNRRFLFIPLLIAALTAPAAEPQPAAATPAGTPVGQAVTMESLNAALADLLAAQPAWSATAALHAGFGYKDNLLLSRANPERSSFGRAGVEALLWHIPKGAIDYFGFVNGERTRYFQGQSVDHEAQAFAGMEWRYKVPDRLTFTLDAQSYYLDQVFDISDTETQRVVADLQVTGLKLGPTLRWTFRPWLWAEATATGTRETFRDGLNNARITKPAVSIGWKPTKRVQLVLTTSELRRRFDRRTGYSAYGTPETTLLVVHERELEGRLDTTWGRSEHWKTRLKGGVRRYTDNTSGFLNYTDRRAGLELEWNAGKWLARVEGEAGRKVYELQRVGAGIGSARPAMLKEEFTTVARVERKLSERWTLFVESTWDRTRSNDELASYHMNEGLLGARWSWEK